MPVISQELRNNVMLISEPIAASKTTAIGFWFPTGSRDEYPGNRGVTHFVEHMLFKGTHTVSPSDFARRFDRMGGYVNAFTEREVVCLYCVVPVYSVSEALSLLCMVITDSVFSSDELERERAVIQNEILTARDDPEEAALDAVCETIWPEQSISALISGTAQQVETLTRDQLFSWYTEKIVHGQLIVSVAGGCDMQCVQEHIASLPDHQPVVHKKSLSGEFCIMPHQYQIPAWKGGLHMIPARFQQEQYFALYPVQYPVSPDTYASYAVINALAGEAMSSRLFQTLREKNGYCYSVYSFFSFYQGAGCWCAYASSSPRYAQKIAADLAQVLNTLKEDAQSGGITDSEIVAAKEHLCGEEIISSEDTEYRMKRLARKMLAGHPLASTDEIISQIQQTDRPVIEKDTVDLLQNTKDRSVILFGPELKKKDWAVVAANFLTE